GTAGSITWGVIMLNFINTAFTYRDLTRDGDFSAKDIGKVTYGLGYSFNLLMGVFVEAPWAVISSAKPIVIGTYTVGILDKSAAYWKARGNVVWGDAIRGFRGSMVAMGGFGIAAVTLELIDIYDDLTKLKTTEEIISARIKFGSVGLMAVGSIFQLAAGVSPASSFALIALSSWFSVTILVIGAVYLLTTMTLNYFKQDSIGWWLRRCSWSKSINYRYKVDPDGQLEEKLALFTIQLSPQIYVKSTTRDENHYFGRDTPYTAPVQYGAGIQILLPSAVRGQSVHFNIISSKRPLGVLPVTKIDEPILYPFLDRGQFKEVGQFKKLVNQPARKAQEDFTFPLMPPEGEDVVWETWVPLENDATYLELQIWYPDSLIKLGQQDVGYLFQLELSSKGGTAVDGLANTELEIKTYSRISALTLEIAE
ncbi:hypothetical protein, partial [Pseudomonas congelans]